MLTAALEATSAAMATARKCNKDGIISVDGGDLEKPLDNRGERTVACHTYIVKGDAASFIPRCCELYTARVRVLSPICAWGLYT